MSDLFFNECGVTGIWVSRTVNRIMLSKGKKARRPWRFTRRKNANCDRIRAVLTVLVLRSVAVEGPAHVPFIIR
jgi:hypothetical protein